MRKNVFIVLLLIILATVVTSTAQKPNFPEGMPIVERPFTDDPDKFTFAIIGDKTGGGRDKWHIFDRAIDEINTLKPDFAIMVGDLIQGDTTSKERLESQWKEFWEHQSDLAVPFLPLPGNHDISNHFMYNYWKKEIGRTYSAFTYKNCLFLLLNTEEWWENDDDEWTNWFGEKQIEYAKAQLSQHANVRHTFVFMHRPLWLHENSGWGQIETELGMREYTVFAGHYHKLTLYERNDRRYFVLGATGGSFTPQEVRKMGAFDHYSLVTVDDTDVNIAIIEPGNVYPADISIQEFRSKVSRQLSFKHNFKFDRNTEISSGSIDIRLKNTLEKPLTVELVFDSTENWMIAPNKLQMDVEPGLSTNANVNISVRSDSITPFPIYRYSMQYGGEQLSSGTRLFHPVDREAMKVIKEWMLLGPFDLGLKSEPSNSSKVPDVFNAIQLPETEFEKTYSGHSGEVSWIEHHTEPNSIQLRKLFGNAEMTYGFGMTYIKSPDARKVFAQVRWGGNLGKIYLNGVEIPNARIPNKNLFSWWIHFELPLKKGWNSFTFLTADYNGFWDFRLEVADTENILQFCAREPKDE